MGFSELQTEPRLKISRPWLLPFFSKFMNEYLKFDIEMIVSLLIVLSIIIGIANNRMNSIGVRILNRWARWVCVSVGLAFFVHQMDWAARPFWTLAIIFFLCWLLLETLYTWLAINAMSQSALALFPRFRNNSTGEEWPAQRKMIELRDWLKAKNFNKRQALVAELGGGITLRSSIYQNENGSIRTQILFLPRPNGTINHCVSFTSETSENERLITDNLNTPYGGFYPGNWNVSRKPWTRSPEKLLKHHLKRIQELELEEYEIDPVDDINRQQGVLERINIEAGFLVPPHLQDEMGRITWEGRYRVWKEVWLLNYFGIAGKG
ncbi:MAG: hypothetical protein HN867_10785 [Deltaproteobacteria bacterium]|nr:hypothetical protein [Deltaproteobacteria bacterium]